MVGSWIKENRTWVFSGVGVMIIGVVASIVLNRNNSPTQQQTQSGTGNIQAGRDVTVVNPAKQKKEAILEVTNVGFTHEAEFDVTVRNLGDIDLVITKITITKITPAIGYVFPILHPTAIYHIPVDDISVGKSKSTDVSHVVPANKADRFLIALHTTTIYTLRVTLQYNRGKTVSFEKNTW